MRRGTSKTREKVFNGKVEVVIVLYKRKGGVTTEGVLLEDWMVDIS